MPQLGDTVIFQETDISGEDVRFIEAPAIVNRVQRLAREVTNKNGDREVQEYDAYSLTVLREDRIEYVRAVEAFDDARHARAPGAQSFRDQGTDAPSVDMEHPDQDKPASIRRNR